MTFIDPDRGQFQAVLRKAGYYGEMRAKFGDAAWSLLEKSIGRQLG